MHYKQQFKWLPLFFSAVLFTFVGHSAGHSQIIFQEQLSYPSLNTYRSVPEAVETQNGMGIGFSYQESGSLDNFAGVTMTDQQGQHVWTTRIRDTQGSFSTLYAQATIGTSDGGFLQIGSILSNTIFEEWYAIKYSNSGTVDWHKVYDGGSFTRNIPFHTIEVEDGFVITGDVTDVFPGEQRDVFLMKVKKSDGSIVWQHRYVLDDYDEEGRMVVEDAEGNFFIVAQSHGSDALLNTYVYKTDASGSLTWLKTYDWGDYEYGHAIAITPDDGFVVLTNQHINGTQNDNMIVMRANSSGTPQWSSLLEEHQGTDVIPSADGQWIVQHGEEVNFPTWATKFSTTGSSLWTQKYAASIVGASAAMYPTSDQGFTFASLPANGSVGFTKADFYGDSKCSVEPGEINLSSPAPTVGDQEPNDEEPFTEVVRTYEVSTVTPEVTVYCCGRGQCPPPNSSINSKFEKHFGAAEPDEGYGVVNLDNNGFLLSGSTDGGIQGRDLLFVSTDNYGNFCWAQQYDLGANRDEWAIDVAKGAENELCDAHYFTGYSLMNNFDLVVGQLDGQGLMQWWYNYGGAGLTAGLDVDYEFGNVNVAGFSNLTGNPQEEGLVLSFASDGTQLLNFTFGEDGSNERFYSTVRVGPYYTMAGFTDINKFTTRKDVYLVQTLGGGSINYDVTFGTTQDDIAQDMALHGSNLYITGRTRNASNGWDVFLAQVTFATGAVNWFHVFTDTENDLAYSLTIDDANEKVFIGGKTLSDNANGSAFVIETDLNGNLVKARRYGGPGTEVFHRIGMDQNGRVVGVGNTNTFNGGDQDLYFCKMLDLETECEVLWEPLQVNHTVSAVQMNGDFGPSLSSGSPNELGNSQIDTFESACESSSGGGSGGGKMAGPVDLLDASEGFQLYPNPANASVTLRYRYDRDLSRAIEVFDLGGRLLGTAQIHGASGTLEMSTSHLVPGLYLVKVSGPSGRHQVQKLTVNR